VDSAPSESIRQTRRLVLLAVCAAVLALALPPVGLGLGVLTLVALVVRHRRKIGIPRPVAVLTITAATFAVLAGGLLSVVLVLFGTETSALRECLAGANTRVAEQVCQDEFTDSIRQRVFR
jgi:hypothetical protein